MPYSAASQRLFRIILTLTFAAPVPLLALGDEPGALQPYNAAIAESSVSGISSGGYMAVQFGTAWSSVIKGVGVVAGGPFTAPRPHRPTFGMATPCRFLSRPANA